MPGPGTDVFQGIRRVRAVPVRECWGKNRKKDETHTTEMRLLGESKKQNPEKPGKPHGAQSDFETGSLCMSCRAYPNHGPREPRRPPAARARERAGCDHAHASTHGNEGYEPLRSHREGRPP